mmetsp:Transcript_23731/g.53426  ORF Transcript_23731/g.53426 Transcript_23731/m.53426 type:complete len:294 (+) Transcript_23731:25-906(+)
MPLRAGLFQCAGLAGKLNWLLVRHVTSSRCVVFFPGDISDFASKQAPYSYSLEGLLWVLCCKYPDDTIVLVKPRMMLEHFAIYANFMMVDGTGNPRHLTDRRVEEQANEDPSEFYVPAAKHLKLLLESLGRELKEDLPRQLILVGFSKGAAVLNALMRDPSESLWSMVRTIHFVDAGLAVPGVFPLRDEELQELRRVAPDDLEVWLHCTPRQVEDTSRPFVAQEHDMFEARCKACGILAHRRTYASGLPVSLEMHFDALRCFVTGENDEDGGNEHCGFFQAWRAVAEAEEEET